MYQNLLNNNYDHINAFSYDRINSYHSNVKAATEADIIILHVVPSQIEYLYRLYPILNEKYVIGYLVWETSELPEHCKNGLKLIQEVWTSSRYCCNIFRNYHDNVIYIPHVIDRDTSCSDQDYSLIKELLKYDNECKYYLTIAAVSDKRKNVKALVNAFINVSGKIEKARLIIKSCWSDDPPNYINNSKIIYLRNDFTVGELNALYKLSDVFVSAHHSEGWGLTLSDAMVFKLPVIATGYSGNLDFMNNSNSFLINYKEDYIRPEDEDCDIQFLKHMRWAYPDETDLEAKLIMLYRDLDNIRIAKKVEKASQDIKKFGRNEVKRLIQKRLEEIRVKIT